MILCDREVEAVLDQGRIIIDPRPAADYMDSTTVDLCLDGTLDVWEFPPTKPGLGQKPHMFCPGHKDFKFADIEEEFTKPLVVTEEKGHELPPSYQSTPETGPRHFILGWTIEKIYLPYKSRLCARVEGKSSLGRMGLGVHVTAPTIHAGFGHNAKSDHNHGRPLRLEIWNIGPLPIVLTKGMRICQLIIEEVREVPRAGYKGVFNQQGPVPKGSEKKPRENGQRRRK
jgi:dCTP deaminase